MKHPTAWHASRRQFLRQAGLFSALTGTAAPLALNLAAIGTAAAQSAGDYRALVCLDVYKRQAYETPCVNPLPF